MLFVNSKIRLALGELRSTTSGLQTVLLEAKTSKPLRHKGLLVLVFQIAVFIATLAALGDFAISLHQSRQRLI